MSSGFSHFNEIPMQLLQFLSLRRVLSQVGGHAAASFVLLGLFCLAAFGQAALAAQPGETEPPGEPVTLTLSFARLHTAPQEVPQDLLPEALQPPLTVAVVTLTPRADIHFYSHEPGAMVMPLKAAVTSHANYAVAYPVGGPEPDVFDPSLLVNVHHDPTTLYLLLPDGAAGALTGDVRLQACTATSCLPLRLDLAAPLGEGLEPLATGLRDELFTLLAENPPTLMTTAVATASEETDATIDITDLSSFLEEPEGGLGADQATAGQELVQAMEPRYYAPAMEVHSLLKAMLLALLAGFILNFMPCVLPVVSLKLSSLMAASATPGSVDCRGEGTELEAGCVDRYAFFRKHNLAFAAGVLVFFGFLALFLGLAGKAWGALFQDQTVLVGMIGLVFALSLSLFGVFSLPVIDLKGGHAKTDAKHPLLGAFATGLLATLLATPCSGPFLGGVLGWALRQEPLVIVAVFMAIGLGMASPYLVMVVFPSLARFFPRPGAWTGKLEQVVGFFLMGTVVYLISILGDEAVLPVLVLLLVISLAAWIWGAFTNLSQNALTRYGIRVAAVGGVLLAAAYLFAPSPPPLISWQPLTPELLAEHAGERTMLVDFTADWCPNCKVLERATLNGEVLAPLVEGEDLLLVQADLTHENPFAQAMLSRLGSSSIPLVALIARDDPANPLVLRDLFTPAQLREALDSLATAP